MKEHLLSTALYLRNMQDDIHALSHGILIATPGVDISTTILQKRK